LDIVAVQTLSYIGVLQFRETFCGFAEDLGLPSESVLEKCLESANPLHKEGWAGRPDDGSIRKHGYEGLNYILVYYDYIIMGWL
jgi:hypothetical protein